jgi:hypothetical protein
MLCSSYVPCCLYEVEHWEDNSVSASMVSARTQSTDRPCLLYAGKQGTNVGKLTFARYDKWPSTLLALLVIYAREAIGR